MNSSLELFILALIQQGYTTPYDLLSRAGLSIGAAHPALGRLTNQGMVTRTNLRDRGKTRYALTAKGKKALQSWPTVIASYLRELPRDNESVIRVAALAWSAGRGMDAAKLLDRAAKRPLDSAVSKKLPKDDPSLPSVYRWMSQVRAGACAKAECQALSKLSQELKRDRS